MTRAAKMNKRFMILPLLGIVLVAAGLIIQAVITSNENFQGLNEFMVYCGLGHITPAMVGETLRKGINFFGTHYSFYDALTTLGTTATEARQLIAAANIYAMTPFMIGLGIISLVITAVAFFGSKNKKIVPALYHN